MKQADRDYVLQNIGKKAVKIMSAELGIEERKIRKFIERERLHGAPDAPTGETHSRVRSKFAFPLILLIVVLGCIVYANSVPGKFIYDDEYLVKNNSYIKQWSGLGKIFTENIVSGAAIKGNFYRPLQLLTYMAEYSAWKLNPLGYHVTSIALHILVAMCIYWLINILFKDRVLALFTGALFVVYPVHTMVVSYISGRADILSFLFILLSLIFYIKYTREDNALFLICMMAGYALALLSKENSLNLPVLILLYHYTFKEKIKLRAFVPALCLFSVYMLLRFTLLKALLSNVTYPTTLLQRIPGFFVAVANYARLIILPFDLHLEYGLTLFNFSDPAAAIGVLIICAALFYAFAVRKKDRIVFFGISWFFLTLAPQSNLYPINAYMSESWLYLPSMGIFLIVAKALSYMYEKRTARAVVMTLIMCLFIFYSYLTIRQNAVYWRDPIAFFERTLKFSPDNAKIYNNLGNAYKAAGRQDEARESYRKAVEIDPGYAKAYSNLGGELYESGKRDEAIAFYKKAIELSPSNAAMHANLGLIYVKMGRNDEAAALFGKAIKLETNDASAYNGLGSIYLGKGRNDEAAKLFKKAIEINPGYADPYNNLGLLYNGMKNRDEAIRYYKKAIEVNPKYATAYSNLGAIYFTDGNKGGALDLFKKAVEASPRFAEGYANLAMTYDALGEHEMAAEAYKKASELGYNVNFGPSAAPATQK